jgi:peptidoglycan/LPS O-acetylase OafA/YrhL
MAVVMKRLEILDCTRFIAALTVVLYHYTFNGIHNTKISSITYFEPIINFTKYGYLGVELFFMISGYVIFQSANNRTAAEFSVSRALRLYPAYWFAVIFTSFFAFNWGGELMQVNPLQVTVNLTMLQSFFYVPHVDGVYWTLVYEIKFYLAVFLLLLFKLNKHLRTIFTFWPVVLLLALIFGLEKNTYLGGYYYYFAAGAIFGVITSKKSWPAFFNLFVIYMLCIYFSASNAALITETKGVEHSAFVTTCIVTLFFALFIYQNSESGREIKIPKSRLLGSLTYPMYLIHAHFGYMLLSKFANEQNKFFVYFLILFSVIVISYFISELIEKRMQNFWRSFFNQSIGKTVNILQALIEKSFYFIKNK